MFSWIFITLIRLYRIALSPFMGNCCRFFPSCSEYGMEAVRKHGPWKGVWRIAKRIAKCNPFHPGGIDPP